MTLFFASFESWVGKTGLEEGLQTECILKLLIAGRGKNNVKNTGRGVVWVEKRWSREHKVTPHSPSTKHVSFIL